MTTLRRRSQTAGGFVLAGLLIAALLFSAASRPGQAQDAPTKPPLGGPWQAPVMESTAPLDTMPLHFASEGVPGETVQPEPMVEEPEYVPVGVASQNHVAPVMQNSLGQQVWQLPNAAAPHPISGVDCAAGSACGELGWGAMRPLDWQPYAQGEYVGHARAPHVPEYRIRVDDLLDFVFRLTREETSEPYQLQVGDHIRVESLADPALDRELILQPDGTLTLRLVGQVRGTGKTVDQLRQEIEALYTEYYQVPAITVTPLLVNTRLEDLRATVDARAGSGGQQRQARVTPEGTIALPAIGNVMVQGLTLDELKRELDERFAAEVEGIEVTPILVARAPRFVYIIGEVRQPGRYPLEGPTTVMQAMSMAGGWNVGGNLRQIVVFRRGDDWRLMATMLDLRGAVYGKMPCPADEIWLNDADVIVVPKSPVLVLDEFINLVFTRGIYGVLPFGSNVSYSWSAGSL